MTDQRYRSWSSLPPPPNTRYYQYFIIYVTCVLYMYFTINFFCMYSTFLNCMYQQSWKDQCTNILYDFRCGRLCICSFFLNKMLLSNLSLDTGWTYFRGSLILVWIVISNNPWPPPLPSKVKGLARTYFRE